MQRKLISKFIHFRTLATTVHDFNRQIYAKIDKPIEFDKSAFEEWPKPIIFRNWLSFLVCQFDLITKHAPTIMNLGNHRYNPLRPFFQIGMKHTVYNQFVGGDTDADISETCANLKKRPVYKFLCFLLSDLHRNRIICSHFGHKFDIQLLADAAVSLNLTPKCITQGAAILRMEIAPYGILFYDSFQYFRQSL